MGKDYFWPDRVAFLAFVVFCLGVLALAYSVLRAEAQEITLLPGLLGENCWSEVLDVSDDGTAVGYSQSSGGFVPTRWINEVPEALPMDVGWGREGMAWAISRDGSLIFGDCNNAAFLNQAAVWEHSVFQPIPLGGCLQERAVTMSPSGHLLVGGGYCYPMEWWVTDLQRRSTIEFGDILVTGLADTGTYVVVDHAAGWSEVVTSDKVLGVEGYLFDISADGQVAVGSSNGDAIAVDVPSGLQTILVTGASATVVRHGVVSGSAKDSSGSWNTLWQWQDGHLIHQVSFADWGWLVPTGMDSKGNLYGVGRQAGSFVPLAWKATLAPRPTLQEVVEP